MNRLPHEVIAQILLCACDPSLARSFDTYDLRPQIRCSHVCRYWRDVALGTPALWASIVISDTMDLSQPLYFALFDLAWARIGHTPPLSLIRISELDLAIAEPGSWNANDLAPLREGCELPLLRRLVLDLTGIDIVCPQLRTASFKACPPRLRTIAASGSFDFPLLEDLALSDLAISVCEIHRIISGAAFLERLALVRVTVSADPRLKVLERMPSQFLATEMDPNSVLAVLRLAATDTVLADVSYSEPQQAWGFFSQLPDLLTLDELSTIRRIKLDTDGLNLTLWDDLGRRRFVMLPKDSEAVWNMLADRKGIFNTVEEWELGSDFASVWKVAIARGGFAGAKLVTFEDQPPFLRLGSEPAPSTGYPSSPLTRDFPISVRDIYNSRSSICERRKPGSLSSYCVATPCAWPHLRKLQVVLGINTPTLIVQPPL
ncbi:hypothetical protein EXIGLDRAFT_777361 [Exidia glandulosa HHB12029]|uniref:F-box domain-containing protein n=1 Tax=Exidia glandulosa HHB12029 TaxID=1314781 RepID=A0A165D1L2_EXIGL|nr:hypothetical protein EXIGLDRAFT_777361 [Exidia glandulosa HHB12029]